MKKLNRPKEKRRKGYPPDQLEFLLDDLRCKVRNQESDSLRYDEAIVDFGFALLDLKRDVRFLLSEYSKREATRTYGIGLDH